MSTHNSLPYSNQFERGHSFNWAGAWKTNTNYLNDSYVTDFIVCDRCLLACRKNHLSSTKPVILFVEGKPADVDSPYWEFVVDLVKDNPVEISSLVYNAGTGKLTILYLDGRSGVFDLDISSLTDATAAALNAATLANNKATVANDAASRANTAAAGIEDFLTNGIKSSTGSGTSVTMSQKAITDALGLKISKLQGTVNNLVLIDTDGGLKDAGKSLSDLATSDALSTLSENVYTKTQVDNLLASFYRIKGSVATYEDLPNSGNKVGDIYKVIATGNCYIWTASGWDLWSSGTADMDLSGYLTTTDAETTYLAKTSISSWALQPTKPSYSYSEISNTPTIPNVPSWALAQNKPTYDYSEIQNTPTIPSVPSWALQPSKPTYNYSEIQNPPTIPSVPSWALQTNKPDYTWAEIKEKPAELSDLTTMYTLTITLNGTNVVYDPTSEAQTVTIDLRDFVTLATAQSITGKKTMSNVDLTSGILAIPTSAPASASVENNKCYLWINTSGNYTYVEPS